MGAIDIKKKIKERGTRVELWVDSGGLVHDPLVIPHLSVTSQPVYFATVHEAIVQVCFYYHGIL